MNLLDRQMIYAYLKAYAFCLASLLSLYVVVDMFTNIEDFARGEGLVGLLRTAGTYYGYRVWQIFDRLCEAVALLAAMFTVAWMQRNNELLPLLSAGVSTRRVVLPVIVSACLMLGLAAANQELIIPRIAQYLSFDRDDPEGNHETPVQGAFDGNGIHFEGGLAARQSMTVKPFCCSIPENIASGLIHLTAAEARYIPPGGGPRSGGWLLLGCNQPPELENWKNPKILEVIDPGKYFLYTTRVDFDTITRSNQRWYMLLSTRQLVAELNKPDSARLSAMAVTFHMRLTRPIIGILLVLLGLAVILRDQNRNIFISAGLCLIVCAFFFGACFTCKQLGDTAYLFPSLAAWLPVLIFGPIAFVLFDAVHT
jgi:lipopolysaccharide export system permease protein